MDQLLIWTLLTDLDRSSTDHKHSSFLNDIFANFSFVKLVRNFKKGVFLSLKFLEWYIFTRITKQIICEALIWKIPMSADVNFLEYFWIFSFVLLSVNSVKEIIELLSVCALESDAFGFSTIIALVFHLDF